MSLVSRLIRLFRESKELDFQKFLDSLEKSDKVIDATDVFEQKKKEDRNFKKAVERMNNVGKPLENEE